MLVVGVHKAILIPAIPANVLRDKDGQPVRDKDGNYVRIS